MRSITRLFAAALLASTVIACANEDPQVSTASGEVEDTTTTTEGTKKERPSTTTTAAKVGVKIVVAEAGLSSGPGYDGQPRGTAGAVLKNEGDEAAAFFEVVFTFKDAGGTAVGTETTYVYAVDPGGVTHAAVDGVTLQGEAASVDATAIVDDDDFDIWEGVVIPVTVTAVNKDQFGFTVTGTANNPANDVIESASVTCVLRSGGRIVGGLSTYLDTLAPAAQVAWEGFSSMENLTADAAECSGGVYE